MIFEQIRTGGCLSYVIGCEETRAAILVDPELDQCDRYVALIAERGLRMRYLLDTHTHADHFTATHEPPRSSICRSSCTGTAWRRSWISGSRTARS